MTIIYTIDTIKKINQSITTIFSKEIITSLLEIKNNNIFIKRKSTLRINTETVSEWRKIKQNNELSIEELLNSNLNKLSSKNFNIINIKICKIFEDNKDNTTITSIFFKKILTDKNNMMLYIKIILNNDYLLKQIIDLLTNYNKNVLLNNDTDYDDICKKNDMIDQRNNYYYFISLLYINNIIEDTYIISEFESLMLKISEYTQDNQDMYLNYYFKALTNLLEPCIKTLSINYQHYNSIIMEPIKKIQQDKTLPNKFRFAIMDILDKV